MRPPATSKRQSIPLSSLNKRWWTPERRNRIRESLVRIQLRIKSTNGMRWYGSMLLKLNFAPTVFIRRDCNISLFAQKFRASFFFRSREVDFWLSFDNRLEHITLFIANSWYQHRGLKWNGSVDASFFRISLAEKKRKVKEDLTALSEARLLSSENHYQSLVTMIAQDIRNQRRYRRIRRSVRSFLSPSILAPPPSGL